MLNHLYASHGRLVRKKSSPWQTWNPLSLRLSITRVANHSEEKCWIKQHYETVHPWRMRWTTTSRESARFTKNNGRAAYPQRLLIDDDEDPARCAWPSSSTSTTQRYFHGVLIHSIHDEDVPSSPAAHASAPRARL